MKTVEVVQLAAAGRDNQWPLLVPRTILTQYQPVIGVPATSLWINLYEIAAGGAGTEFVSVQSQMGTRMGLAPEAIEQAAVMLEEAGLLRRTSGRWTVLWPASVPEAATVAVALEAESDAAPEGVAVPGPIAQDGTDEPSDVNGPDDVDDGTGVVADFDPAHVVDAALDSDLAAAPVAGDTAVDTTTGWNSDEAALQAVVQFYHQRIGMLGPSQFEKLRFWVEEQGMSSDVVALAIEETVQSAPTPRIAYVEGVLRNWYNDGIRTLAHLQNSKRVRSQEVPPTTEGTPNAASFDAVDRDAVRRWKEMYSDEYDD